MGIQLINNAWSYLGANVNSGQTTIIVNSGADFPTLTGADYFYATLVSLSAGFDAAGNPNLCEIIKVLGPYTAGQTNLSVVRGQDGTAPASFAAGDLLDVRPCRAALLELSSVAGALLAVNNLSDVANKQTSLNNLGLRIFSVRNYGASGNGVTDDTAAINLAIAALVANNGGCLYFPEGNYKVTGALTTISVFALIAGQGRASSIVTTNQGTGNVFTITGQYVKMMDMQVSSSVNRTANALVDVQAAASYFQMTSCTLNAGYINLATAATSIDVSYSNFLNPTAVNGIGIQVTGGLDLSFSHNVLVSTGTQPAAGMQVANCGDIALTDCSIIKQGHGLLCNPGNGQVVASLTAVNSGFDNCSQRGVAFIPTGTGGVVRSRFVGCWIGAATLQGFLAVAGGATTINGIDLTDCHVFGNGSDGALFSTSVLNVRVLGGEFAGNVGSGINFTNCTDFAVIGAKSGTVAGFGVNGAFGVNIVGAASDNFVVTNNDLRGNTGGPWSNASTVTTNTWSILNNLGGAADPVLRPNRMFVDGFNGAPNSRFTFQSYTGNNSTVIQAAPAGTGAISGFFAYGASDLTGPAGYIDLRMNSSTQVGRIGTDQINGGTIPDLQFFCGGIRMQCAPATGFWRMGPTLAADDNIHPLQLNGSSRASSFHSAVAVKTAATYTALSTDSVLLLDATSNNITITLPAANAAGAGFSCSLRFKRIDGTANVVTIQRAGADLIDGAVSTTLAPLQAVDVESDGVTNWYLF